MRYDALVERITKAPVPVRLVAIDGCGGAGKSTFAARLSRRAGDCPIVPTDDFASWNEPLDWWPRLRHEVIDPLLAGRPATYRRFDWERHAPAETVTVGPEPIVVIEGVSASRREWRDVLSFSVWIETPRELRLRRGLDRDGESARDLWAAWMVAEDDYVQRDRPAERADIVVDGNPTIAHDVETEFVRLPF